MTNSNLYVNYLRKKGVIVGKGTVFFGRKGVDVTRPCLVEIGNNCAVVSSEILTHGYDWLVLRNKYGEMLSSSGKIVIEDNVFIGTNSIILKGVRIGRDTIIGAGSVVTHNIPPMCVAAGNPCEVIMSIDEYYRKRKKKYIEEAKVYARELYRKKGKPPKMEDFWEEFPIFVQRDGDWGRLPVRQQLGRNFEDFLRSTPQYPSFEAFLADAGIPCEKKEERKAL
jgi:acetyltransferase-like isoleucine patch superfamily enzyme